MAESIALGMRLATADELATVAGIEGEISVTEGEWRAVVHDGVTKGGYPLAKLAEAGYSLTKSEDGTKLQLKNKNGVVLSETDAPTGVGGGIHIGDDAPEDEETNLWIDTDESAVSGVMSVNGVRPGPDGNVTIQTGGDTSNLVPKTGDRGVLAGFNTLNDLTDPTEVTINASSPDDTKVFLMSSSANIIFALGEAGQTFTKQVFVFNFGKTLTLTLPEQGVAFGDGTTSYTPNMLDLFVYVWYGDMGVIYTKQIM